MDRSCQTVGLRKVHIINPGLCKIAAYVSVNFPVLQVRSLLFSNCYCCTRNWRRISRSNCCWWRHRVCINEGNFVDLEKTGKLLEKLRPAYVFCAGVSKTEFQAVCSGVRYVPKLGYWEKCAIQSSCLQKKCLKWYTLRTNATRDERNLVLERDNRCAECNQMYHRARFTSRRNLDIPLKGRLQRT